MIHSRAPQSDAFNGKLNQKKVKPLSSFLSRARTPLRDLSANVEEPNRKPNDGKVATTERKGTDSLKKPLRVIDNIQPKKAAPRNDSNQQPNRSQIAASGAAPGQRTDRQRTVARSKASDRRVTFKVYDDANGEQVASMRSSRAAARDEAIGKVRRVLLNQEHPAANGQQDTVFGRGKLGANKPSVSPVKVHSYAKPIEKSPNGTHRVEKEPISPVSFPVVPTNSPATPIPPITSTPEPTYVPRRAPSASPLSPSQADCTATLTEAFGTEAPGTQLSPPFGGDSQRSSIASSNAGDVLVPAMETCSIAPKPADVRPILGRKIVGRSNGSSPQMSPITGPMRTLYPTRNTVMKLPGFEHLTEYFPDRAEEIQRFYRQKEFRRRKAIESMMIQNTRQTQQEGYANAVSSVALFREPNEPGNGSGGPPVDKFGSTENKYGAIGQTKNGYAPGICARQLVHPQKQAVKQRISYETEELLRLNFLVCGNLCHSKTHTRNQNGVRSNAAHGTAIGTRR